MQIIDLRPRSSKVFLTVEQQSEHFFPTTGQNKLGNKIPLFSPLLVSKLTMPLGSLSYIAFPVIMINILNLYGLVCVSALFSFSVYLLIYILYESTLHQYMLQYPNKALNTSIVNILKYHYQYDLSNNTGPVSVFYRNT